MKTKITTRTSKNEPLIISIRCDDECKNGHDTFAITASLYKKNATVLSDRNWQAGGCLHEEILKAKKSLKIFVDLHLSNGNGVPMYAVENGFYYYQKLKGTYKTFEWMEFEPADEKYFDVLCKHLRINEKEGKELIERLDKVIGKKESFVRFVEVQKKRWLSEALQAKELLKQLIEENKKESL